MAFAGALCSGARFSEMRWNASNRIGAAAVRPRMPGTLELSGRPTQAATTY
jgi:hypothetical protein